MKSKILFFLLFLLPLTIHAQEQSSTGPWTKEAIQKAFKVGKKATYIIKGESWTGKPVDEKTTYTVAKTDAKEISSKTSSEIKKTGNKISFTTGSTSSDWASMDAFESPFFSMIGPEVLSTKKEKITTPAGTFDCIKAEISSSMDKYIVWMIINQPGIYAKVIKGKEIYELVQ